MHLHLNLREDQDSIMTKVSQKNPKKVAEVVDALKADVAEVNQVEDAVMVADGAKEPVDEATVVKTEMAKMAEEVR